MGKLVTTMSTHAATHLPLFWQHLREKRPFRSLVYHHCLTLYPLLVFKEPPLPITHLHPKLWARARKPTIISTKSPRNPKLKEHPPLPCPAPHQREAKTQRENISTPGLGEDQTRNVHVLRTEAASLPFKQEERELSWEPSGAQETFQVLCSIWHHKSWADTGHHTYGTS